MSKDLRTNRLFAAQLTNLSAVHFAQLNCFSNMNALTHTNVNEDWESQ